MLFVDISDDEIERERDRELHVMYLIFIDFYYVWMPF